MPNFCMTLSYDGTRYNGWQRQGNTPDTVQGRLETALSALLGQPVEVAGSGRTDAGVHARMQTASFRAKTDLPAPELLRRLRAQLPGDIGVLTLAEAGPRFHARLSCRGKTYVYRVWNSDTPNVFERRYVYALPQPLDTAAMQRAAALLCGRHDYTSFCANRRMKKSAVRTVDAITVERLGDEVRLTFSGEGFLYHMVRASDCFRRRTIARLSLPLLRSVREGPVGCWEWPACWDRPPEQHWLPCFSALSLIAGARLFA